MDEKRTFVVVAPSGSAVLELLQRVAFVMQFSLYEIHAIIVDPSGKEELERLGVRTIVINNHDRQWCADTRYILSILRHLIRIKPDALLGYTTKCAAYGAIAAKIYGVRSISSLLTKSTDLGAVQRFGIKASHHILFFDENNKTEFDLEDKITQHCCHIFEPCSTWSNDTCDLFIDALDLEM